MDLTEGGIAHAAPAPPPPPPMGIFKTVFLSAFLPDFSDSSFEAESAAIS